MVFMFEHAVHVQCPWHVELCVDITIVQNILLDFIVLFALL